MKNNKNQNPESDSRNTHAHTSPSIITATNNQGEIYASFLDYGGHIALAVAVAAFGVVALSSPFFNLSKWAIATLQYGCFGGAGIWAALSTEYLYKRLIKERKTKKILIAALSALFLIFGMTAIYNVMQYTKGARIAQICERVENIKGDRLANSSRCKYYYSTREASEQRVIFGQD